MLHDSHSTFMLRLCNVQAPEAMVCARLVLLLAAMMLLASPLVKSVPVDYVDAQEPEEDVLAAGKLGFQSLLPDCAALLPRAGSCNSCGCASWNILFTLYDDASPPGISMQFQSLQSNQTCQRSRVCCKQHV